MPFLLSHRPYKDYYFYFKYTPFFSAFILRQYKGYYSLSEGVSFPYIFILGFLEYIKVCYYLFRDVF